MVQQLLILSASAVCWISTNTINLQEQYAAKIVPEETSTDYPKSQMSDKDY